HLGELRRRLLISFAALVAASIVAWFFYNHAITFMAGPYRSFLAHHPGKDISAGNLITTGPLEGFTTRLQISGYLGVLVAAPVWLWELWRFVGPGLHDHERRYARSFIASAVTLFSLGVATAVLVFPKAVDWMINVSGTGVAPLFAPSKYFGLYALCCVIFGTAFTYPVILVFLELTGVLSSAKLRKWRRYAIVTIVAVAAVITPSNDPFSFLAMAVPLVVFYEAAIGVGRLLHR
ncbi:MAG: twin-arginine translocase subunit TatC, partial [Acidimicrobiales bacterium]